MTWIALLLAASGSGWLDIPYVHQTGSGCGAAAVAMVIQYWARQQPSLADAAMASERINEDLPAGPKGIQGNALKSYLEAHGFDVFVFRGERSDLEQQFQKGRPLVVCLGPKGARGPFHYAVVAGIDPEAVWLNDPARGKLIREDRRHFEAAWKESDNWSLLAVPRQLR
ncbi:MAG TPA: papain-like cysteine protease family protein [Bryobacteraceae bacterium]|nr:papain-like cysteine protease family protein [Bryobacteraceae bacterium]